MIVGPNSVVQSFSRATGRRSTLYDERCVDDLLVRASRRIASLQDIADREAASIATVRLALLKYDVPLHPAGSHPGRPRRR